MLYRTRASAAALVPSSTPFAIIEPVRERLLSGSWLFLPQALAHFALTLQSARSNDRLQWIQAQLLVAASYIEAVSPDASTLAALWRRLRVQRPPSTPLLFQLAFAGIKPRDVLQHARPSDWLRFIAGAIRHPLTAMHALRFREDYPAVWSAMLAGARQRTAEAAARPDVKRPMENIFSKNLG
jgi:hypothetical protein